MGWKWWIEPIISVSKPGFWCLWYQEIASCYQQVSYHCILHSGTKIIISSCICSQYFSNVKKKSEVKSWPMKSRSCQLWYGLSLLRHHIQSLQTVYSLHILPQFQKKKTKVLHNIWDPRFSRQWKFILCSLRGYETVWSDRLIPRQFETRRVSKTLVTICCTRVSYPRRLQF
jgi:hypothetical protein